MTPITLPGDSPEGYLAAAPGTQILDQNGGTWTKVSGTSSTGWRSADDSTETPTLTVPTVAAMQVLIDAGSQAIGQLYYIEADSSTRRYEGGGLSTIINDYQLTLLDVTLSNILANTVALVGPALAETTDGKTVKLQEGFTAGAGLDNDKFEEVLITENGGFVANIELADVSGTVPDANVMGVDVDGHVTAGDGAKTGGVKVGIAHKDVADNAAKLALTDLSTGQLVRITGEADRIEMFTGSDETQNSHWQVIGPNTVHLQIYSDSGDLSAISVVSGTTLTPTLGTAFSYADLGWHRVGDIVTFSANIPASQWAESLTDGDGTFRSFYENDAIISSADWLFLKTTWPPRSAVTIAM